MTVLSKLIRDYDRLQLCIDPGAGSIKVQGRHVRAGIDPTFAKSIPIKIFRTLEPGLDCTVVYDFPPFEQPHVGRTAVKAFTDTNPDQLEYVLHNFKLALCYEYQDSPAVQRIHKFLRVERRGDVQEIQRVYTDVFKVVRNGILEFMMSSSSNIHLREREERHHYWTNIAIELHLPMPCHWDAIQRGVVLDAAKAAGFAQQGIIARSEPLCAMSDLCFKYFESEDLRVRAPSTTLTARFHLLTAR